MAIPQDSPCAEPELAGRCYQAGMAHLDNGDEPAARAAFLRALEHDDSLASAHYQLGNCLRRSGEDAAAEQALTAAITHDASLGEAYISLAFLYHSQGKRDAAAAALLALITARPADLPLHTQVAGLLADMGCHAQAASLYARCVQHQPHNAQLRLKLGLSYQKLGRFGDAERAFLAAIEEDAGIAAAYLLVAHTRHLGRPDTPLIQRFEATLSNQHLSEETRKCLHFSLGKMYDDLGSYAQAFEHFRRANALHRQRNSFDRQALVDYVSSVKEMFSPQLFQNHPATQATIPVPVFIVGMLRSGTTLVERILASHPQAIGLGETELVDGLVQQLASRTGLPYPACMARLDNRLAATLAVEFRAQWPAEARAATRVVDKNPLNFLHLGLIAALFPEAPILHCVRDPLDTCLSIYFQHFAHPRNSYAYALEDIAFFYKQYTALMTHWRNVLPVPIHDIRYEELVREPERVTRDLVADIGLEWHTDCLEPHKHAGSISTASLWQARQPIYRDSVGRWHHYAEYLQPLRQALMESIPAGNPS